MAGAITHVRLLASAVSSAAQKNGSTAIEYRYTMLKVRDAT